MSNRTSRQLRLAEFLPYRLNVLASVASEGLARIYSERFGIDVPQWRVMATVGEFGAITAKALGAHAHMGKVKVSRAAASLEARKLLERQPNCDDKREAFLALTSTGGAMYGEIVPLALDYEAQLKCALTAEEARTLDSIISKLMKAGRR